MGLAGTVPVRIVEQGIDWPAWISAGAAVLTLAVVAVTAIFALVGLWDARRTRHGQLVTEIMRDWSNPDTRRAHVLLASYPEDRITKLVDSLFAPGAEAEATDSDLADWRQLSLLANLIESLGVLCSEKAITPDVVYKMWGGSILAAWPKWDEAVGKLREYEHPDVFIHFEALGREIQRISAERKQLHATGRLKSTRIGKGELT
jgi:hypothetical protein